MSDPCPDPVNDPDGYGEWREAHACPACQGEGLLAGIDAEPESECPLCDGTGVDPDAYESDQPPEWEGDEEDEGDE